MPKTPTTFLQVRKFPRDLLARIDAAAKLTGIKREQLVVESLEDATTDVKELQEKLRSARKRRSEGQSQGANKERA